MSKFINPFTDVGFKRIFGQEVSKPVADVASLSRQERMAYDENLRRYRDTVAVMEGQYLEGMEKGMEKGMASANLANARKMKVKGYASADIAEITGLTQDEIEAL